MFRLLSVLTAAGAVAWLAVAGDFTRAAWACLALGLLISEWRIATLERRLRDAGL